MQQLGSELAGATKNKTVFYGFIGASCNWFLGLAAVYDASSKGAEVISLPMTCVMIAYSTLFTSWAGWAVAPRNFILAGSHMFNVAAQCNQLRRVLEHKMTEGGAAARAEVQQLAAKAAVGGAAAAAYIAGRHQMKAAFKNGPAWFTSPAGPFTIHPWPPATKLLISGASLLEFDRRVGGHFFRPAKTNGGLLGEVGSWWRALLRQADGQDFGAAVLGAHRHGRHLLALRAARQPDQLPARGGQRAAIHLLGVPPLSQDQGGLHHVSASRRVCCVVGVWARPWRQGLYLSARGFVFGGTVRKTARMSRNMSLRPLCAALLAAAVFASPPPDVFAAADLDFAAPPAEADLPPAVGSRAQLDAMLADAIAWAGLNGLLMHASSSERSDAAAAAPLFAHAPFSLLPAEFPADQLEHARKLAPLFGVLVDKAGRDVAWLSSTLRGAAESDAFTRQLLELCARVEREGATQPARLCVLRSDYMLHEPDAAEAGAPRLLQVELNTIASSFGALGAQVGRLHTELARRWRSVRSALWEAAGKPPKLRLRESLPPSDAVPKIGAALARAQAEYGGGDAVILFVVQPGERNELDQLMLAQQLWAAHGVRSVRRTLAQLAAEARLCGQERTLQLQGGEEVGVVYFRAGYAPSDYPSEREWEARATLERSHAIKCPCVQHQLVGCKKVQQQLALPGELERFVRPAEAAALRSVFAGLWSLGGRESPPAGAEEEEVRRDDG